MPQPVLLDAFCCQGGASEGYRRAGYRIVGVDNKPQPKYPFEFIQADALKFIREHGHKFDVIHTSPPCQGYSRSGDIWGNYHPKLIAKTRLVLQEIGHPLWVIENVPAAKSELIRPLELCGIQFGLKVYRHRYFECNKPLRLLPHPKHTARLAKMGRPPGPDEFIHVVGNFSGIPQARLAMGIPWMNRDGLREAVPPAYTEYIGKQLIAA